RRVEDSETDLQEDNEYAYDRSTAFTMDDLGFPLRPARSYSLKVDRALAAKDGQTLGYTWAGLVENWHERSFTSFGDGHGVWEKGCGTLLPFYARNFPAVTQWAAPVDPQ